MRLQLRPALGNRQGIERTLLRAAMHAQPEALGEKALQHQPVLLLGGARDNLGIDVELRRAHPVRRGDLPEREIVRPADDAGEGVVADIRRA